MSFDDVCFNIKDSQSSTKLMHVLLEVTSKYKQQLRRPYKLEYGWKHLTKTTNLNFLNVINVEGWEDP